MATVFKRGGRGPWRIQWFGADGKRREKSTRCTDKRTADRIAAQIESGVALRREGVIDPRTDRFVDENSRPLQEHVSAYLEHLRHAGRSPLTIRDARVHLAWAATATGATRLADLSLDAVEGALSLLQAKGRSARTINYHGQSVRGFLSWAVKSGRLHENPLRFLPRHSEALDRRLVRRALTGKEVVNLLAVADAKKRGLWYRAALYAGLRRSELGKLTWGDVDAQRGVITVRKGKAKRIDEIPIHADLAAALAAARPSAVLPSARVFPTMVTNRTRQEDFKNAGIKTEAEDGLQVDLHSARVWLATSLARAAVAPQIAQRILRHASFATTQKHYVRLEGTDTAAAVASLPSEQDLKANLQHNLQHSENEKVRSAAG
jgi:integrase